jgi:hypothetical protein
MTVPVPQHARASTTEPDSPPPVGPSEYAGEGQDTRRTPFNEKPRSQQAGIKCADDREFQKWLNEQQHSVNPDHCEHEEAFAKRILLEVLGITSRKELDTLPHKAAEWDKLLTSFDMRGYK